MQDIYQLFGSVSNGSALNHAVVIQSRFTLRVGAISGFFLLVLGIPSLQMIVSHLPATPLPKSLAEARV